MSSSDLSPLLWIPLLIPAEARRKLKDGGINFQEPTSPEVSCMGQIKHKKIKKGSKTMLSVSYFTDAKENNGEGMQRSRAITKTPSVSNLRGNIHACHPEESTVTVTGKLLLVLVKRHRRLKEGVLNRIQCNIKQDSKLVISRLQGSLEKGISSGAYMSFQTVLLT